MDWTNANNQNEALNTRGECLGSIQTVERPSGGMPPFTAAVHMRADGMIRPLSITGELPGGYAPGVRRHSG